MCARHWCHGLKRAKSALCPLPPAVTTEPEAEGELWGPETNAAVKAVAYCRLVRVSIPPRMALGHWPHEEQTRPRGSRTQRVSWASDRQKGEEERHWGAGEQQMERHTGVMEKPGWCARGGGRRPRWLTYKLPGGAGPGWGSWGWRPPQASLKPLIIRTPASGHYVLDPCLYLSTGEGRCSPGGHGQLGEVRRGQYMKNRRLAGDIRLTTTVWLMQLLLEGEPSSLAAHQTLSHVDSSTKRPLRATRQALCVHQWTRQRFILKTRGFPCSPETRLFENNSTGTRGSLAQSPELRASLREETR